MRAAVTAVLILTAFEALLASYTVFSYAGDHGVAIGSVVIGICALALWAGLALTGKSECDRG
jgi:hypothetical protein